MDITVILIKAVATVCLDCTVGAVVLKKESVRIRGRLMHFMSIIDEWSESLTNNSSPVKTSFIQTLYLELVGLSEILEALAAPDASWRYRLLRRFSPSSIKQELQEAEQRLNTSLNDLSIVMLYDVNQIVANKDVERRVKQSVRKCLTDSGSQSNVFDVNAKLASWDPNDKMHVIDTKNLKFKENFVSKLGSGGSATVYKGTYFEKNRKIAVAVKVVDISRNYNKFDDMTESDFKKECDRVMGETIRMKHACIHSNVVDVFGCYIPKVKSEFPFIVMELLDSSLFEYIHDKNFGLPSYDNRLKVILGIAGAIKFLHIQGIIHQDIKPANILFNKQHMVGKLTDFGIAENKTALVETWDRKDTITGRTFMNNAGTKIAGTYAYVAPEKILVQEDKASRAADIYSLGVTFWECCSSLIPHDNKKEKDVIALARNIDQPMLPFPIRGVISEAKYPQGSHERNAFNLMEMVAWKCTQRNHSKRPNADDVETMLKVAPTTDVPELWKDSSFRASLSNTARPVKIIRVTSQYGEIQKSTTKPEPQPRANSAKNVLVDFLDYSSNSIVTTRPVTEDSAIKSNLDWNVNANGNTTTAKSEIYVPNYDNDVDSFSNGLALTNRKSLTLAVPAHEDSNDPFSPENLRKIDDSYSNGFVKSPNRNIDKESNPAKNETLHDDFKDLINLSLAAPTPPKNGADNFALYVPDYDNSCGDSFNRSVTFNAADTKLINTDYLHITNPGTDCFDDSLLAASKTIGNCNGYENGNSTSYISSGKSIFTEISNFGTDELDTAKAGLVDLVFGRTNTNGFRTIDTGKVSHRDQDLDINEASAAEKHIFSLDDDEMSFNVNVEDDDSNEDIDINEASAVEKFIFSQYDDDTDEPEDIKAAGENYGEIYIPPMVEIADANSNAYEC